MTALIWPLVIVAVMMLAGTGMALTSRAERRALAGRIADVQPEIAAVAAPRPVAPGFRLPRLLLLDAVLGINRHVASDGMIPVVRCLFMGAIGGGIIYAVTHFLLSVDKPISIAAAVVAGILATRLAVGKRRTAIEDTMEDELGQALGVIIRCVRVGLPVVEGMRAVSEELPMPTGPEFRRCVDQIQLGESFDTALQNMATRCVLPGYRFFAVSVSLQRQTGGNLSETLDNLAETLRKRKALRLKVKALISEPMATVAVLSVLPFAVGGILMLIRPDYVMTLFTTDSGRMMLGIAIVIQSIGLLVIRTMIKQTLS